MAKPIGRIVMDLKRPRTVDERKVKNNDLMAFVYYARICPNARNSGEVDVIDVDSGNPFTVKGVDLIEYGFSADQYSKEILVTKAEIAEELITAYNRPFTVAFVKANGDRRVLRGRLVKPEPLMGRSYVEDLDKPIGDRLRQVDHRTIEYLILEGVKYTVKVRSKC